jgi:hypothetical protein
MQITKRKVELPELVQQLQKEMLLKRDFVIPARCLSFIDGKLIVSNETESKELQGILDESGIGYATQFPDALVHRMGLTPLSVFHNHVSEKLGIPKRYYDRMNSADHLSLLDQNVNHWFRDANTNFLIRTFIDKEEKSGFVRALLSDRFRMIDNYDILLAVLSAIKDTGMKVEVDKDGCDITEKKMYIRFICPEIEIKAPELLKNYRPNGDGSKQNDSIISGFVITNSEVGHGTMSISPRAKVRACSNGLISTRENFSKIHLGSKMEEYSSVKWTEETKQKNLELIISQVKDAIITFSSADFLGKSIANLIEKNKPLVHPSDAVFNVCNSLSMTDEKQNDILSYFIKSGDMTSFGLSQAITFYAHEKADADEQYDLEVAAVDVVEKIDSYDRPVPKKTVKELTTLN